MSGRLTKARAREQGETWRGHRIAYNTNIAPQPKRAGRVCSLCGRLAWYLVGRKAFCGEHRDAAYAAAERKEVAR